MKKRVIVAIVLILLGLGVAVGPRTFVSVCEYSMSSMEEDEMEMSETDCADDKPMTCHWLAQAELGVGLLISILGILLIVLPEKNHFGISISAALNGILVIALPTALIGVCSNPKAHCHIMTRPTLILLGAIIILLTTGNAFYLARKEKTNSEQTDS